MAKGLVIKNVDFSENKLTTVVFNDVPCTAVALDEDSVEIASFADVNIGYTLIPSNTTDTPVWSSSDNTVATVTNGVLKVHGIGECTITLTCGQASASCSVAVDISVSPFLVMAMQSEFTVDDKTYCSLTNTRRFMCVDLLANSEFIHKMDIYNNEVIDIGTGVTGIKIPQNASYVSVYAEQLYSSGNAVRFLDATDSEVSSTNQRGLRVIGSHTLTVTSGKVNEDVAIPAGANAYIVGLRPSTSSVFDNVESETDMQDIFNNTVKASISYKI